ncbi:Phox/Bem1p protein [Actinidia chinensis var. chinensis]|uniref:Phox/Bem1p protein n=1 Tax=Actinidia chinensis var. chinensis TaxID=1590841 RepID=A0A2R6PSA4_ACTCC|nr:Phox/Bem1p protein [Actinidia chinensis var. chinensis]
MTRTVISNTNSTKTIKFLYSYGGKIAPRLTDGELRYVGGMTRVLAVDRSITFAELMVKFGELCGLSMRLKCKLPTEDLDVLVSITCDEDLAGVMDEYDRFSSSTRKDLKITAVLFPFKSLKKISPVPSVDDLCSAASASTGSSGDLSSTTSPPYSVAGFHSPPPRMAAVPRSNGGRNSSPSYGFSGKVRCNNPCCQQRSLPRHLYRCCEQGRPRHIYAAPRWNRCQ